MAQSVSLACKSNFQPRTNLLVEELNDIIPDLIDGEDGEITIQITEDVGPQYLIFRSKTQQLVFKIIDFKSRGDLGIAKTIKKEHSQLVLSNFTSDIGLEVAEFLMEIFPISTTSNQVVNFTVHKDFIYFRMYRFCIKEKGPVMEQIGPHLTLRLWRMTEYSEDGPKTRDFKKYIKNLGLL
ncbi:hypothetical protein PAEPH01_0890 [Pancytospora epiphaga]|nr:hypothetical protein PAEPH01_0890 [Pancytospora epiphaga]